MPFAEKTTVTQERSEAEIKELLRKYGADGFMSGWGEGKAFLAFKCQERMVKFVLPTPNAADERFWAVKRGGRYFHHPELGYGVWRSQAQASELIQQETRRRWRALALVIKAKLEAVSTGITTFESEFLAHIVMPDGRSVGDHVIPAVAEAYSGGKVKLLPEFTA